VKTPAEVAHRDQFLAAIRCIAEMNMDTFTEFIKVGFTRDEALSLTLFYLSGEDDDA